ncbi:MAG: hypothetical protein ACD_40C00197G0015 [uncultured bacterium]|nr:MAG: hypothetical protein ACD_40C00197G0015 [uncultured bacterium]KKU15226.1 MAG: hypothetical protein UX21_C0005G0022 [Microgenomates group bacterium GW2011_GWC2_45_8]
MDMKKSLVYLVVAVLAIIGVYLAVNSNSTSGQGECSKYSNEDGYTGCMSVVSGKEKKCTFKVDNKVNPETQKMEFTYTCSPK